MKSTHSSSIIIIIIIWLLAVHDQQQSASTGKVSVVFTLLSCTETYHSVERQLQWKLEKERRDVTLQTGKQAGSINR